MPPGSPLEGRTVHDLEALGEGNVSIIAVVREGFRRYVPAGHWVLYGEDILVVEGDPAALPPLINRARLELVADHAAAGAGPRTGGNIVVTEAVVTATSPIVGSTLDDLQLRERFGANLLALSRSGGASPSACGGSGSRPGTSSSSRAGPRPSPRPWRPSAACRSPPGTWTSAGGAGWCCRSWSWPRRCC